MCPPQEQNFYTTSLLRRARFLVTEDVFLVVEERFLVTEEGFLVAEEVLFVMEERFLVTEKVFLVVEDKVCFFVYRLVLDAKPDRGML